jgi:hypothetical protein
MAESFAPYSGGMRADDTLLESIQFNQSQGIKNEIGNLE